MRALYNFCFFILTNVLVVSVADAQTDIHNEGVGIFIQNGTDVYFNGSYFNNTPIADRIFDPQIVLNSTLIITENINNNSGTELFPNNNGLVLFMGGNNQSILGNSPITFFDITLSKGSSNLILGRSISVDNNLSLTSGSFDLGNNEISLGLTGELVSETDANRVFSAGTGFLSFIINANPTISMNLGGLGLYLEGDITGGATVERYHAPQSNAADGSIDRVYRINLGGGDFISDIRFEYLTPELNGLSETNLVIYASFDAGASWENVGGNVNVGGNFVVASGLNLDADVWLTLASGICTTPPVVDIGPATLDYCVGEVVTLDAGNPGNTYTWSTGETTQTIDLTSPGTYTVTLRTAEGCEASDTIELIERQIPLPAFNVPIVCEGVSTAFNNTSTGEGTLAYSWDFGDLSSTTDISNVQNPQYQYPSAGQYDVKLIVESQFGCIDSLTRQIFVAPIPEADFTFQNGCVAEPINFISTTRLDSSILSSNGLVFDWDFGDGTSSNLMNPVKTYAVEDDYTVTLTVTSNVGCVDVEVKQVLVSEPVVGFNFTNDCEGEAISFVNNSTISNGILTYEWDFGDGTTSTAVNPTKTYNASGDFNVRLRASSAFNCVRELTRVITIFAEPTADFSVSDDCLNTTFQFTNQSTTTSGTLTYEWDFGDGTTSTLANPTKNYTLPGSYNVSLRAITSLGCDDTENITLEVFPVPTANFSFDNPVCTGDEINLINSSSISSGTLTYEWDFGDGTTSTEAMPFKSYAVADTYTIELIATANGTGCESILRAFITVNETPIVDLGGTIITCGNSFLLDAGNPGSSYLWSDGTTDQTLLAIADGTYSVTVTTPSGCSNSDMVSLTLNGDVTVDLGNDRAECGMAILDAGNPGADYLWSTGATTRTIQVTQSGNYAVTVTDINGCTGSDNINLTIDEITFVDLGDDIIACSSDGPVILDTQLSGVAFLWSDGSTNSQLSVTTTGEYTVRVTNGAGCVDMDTVNVTINTSPIVDFEDQIVACDQLVLDAGNSGSTFLWSDGSITQRITVTQSGSFSVEVTNAFNCSTVETVEVVINDSPTVNLGENIVVCHEESVILDATTNNATYLWSDGSTAATLPITVSGEYFVEVTNAQGCFGRDTIDVTIFPEINVSLPDTIALCQNADILLSVPFDPSLTYTWIDNNGTAINSNELLISSTGRYSISAVNQIGCSASDTVQVITDQDPITARFLSASLVNVGDTVQFVDLSFPNPISYLWNFGDGVTSTESDPTHAYLREGDFDAGLEVRDEFCNNTQVKTITVRLLRQPTDESQFLFTEILEAGIYPNPTSDKIKLDISLNKEADLEIGIYDFNGKVIETRRVNLKEDIIEFNLENIESGTYILRVIVNGQSRVFRFITL